MSVNVSNASSDERIVLNGVDFLSGGYLTPPVTPEGLLGLAQDEGNRTSRSEQEGIRRMSDRTRQEHLGFNAPLEDPSRAHWGVIFAQSEVDAVKKALQPLIDHRESQLGSPPKRFEYLPNMSSADFLGDNDVGAGYGKVEKVPYYLLLVGSPRQIPFRFQYELGSEYAVGRLDFANPDGYRTYVDQLIDYEKSKTVPTRKHALFWATANPDDRPTALSSSLLVQPLHDGLDPKLGFVKQLIRGETATKANLADALARPQRPSLLFTASHGLGFRKADKQQPKLQGALVTQEWVAGTPITPKQIFSGQDVSNGGSLRGLVHFAFACFGAGTPEQDEYAQGRSTVAPIIADFPFVADLPRQELLQGALAFIGHIDRAWGYSFIGPTDKPMQEGFEGALARLLRGEPVGHALRDQHDRALQLSHRLLEDLNEIYLGKRIEPLVIAEKWKERNDARAYAVIGDPAARLRVDAMH